MARRGGWVAGPPRRRPRAAGRLVLRHLPAVPGGPDGRLRAPVAQPDPPPDERAGVGVADRRRGAPGRARTAAAGGRPPPPGPRGDPLAGRAGDALLLRP